MITFEQAQAARDKFKETYWQHDKDKYNVLAVEQYIEVKETEFEGEEYLDIIDGDHYVKVFLFDLDDAKDLPIEIDGVEVKYSAPKKKVE
jgi:hypothetical protein